MPTLRISKTTALADHKLRLAKVTVSGASATPKFRIARAVASGPVPLALQPIPDTTAEAFDPVTVTAVVAPTSPTPTGYSWRQISGPAVTFQDNGVSILFTAPPAMAGATVVFGVTAFVGAQASSEAIVTTVVIPYIYWIAGSDAVWAVLMKQTLAPVG